MPPKGKLFVIVLRFQNESGCFKENRGLSWVGSFRIRSRSLIFLKNFNGLKTPIIFCINVSNLILKKNFFREFLNSTKKKLS